MKVVKIYQLNHECPNKFMSYEFIKNHGGLHVEDYKLVYECVRSDNYTPDDAFREFNVHKPNDFLGHSLSVSDMVSFNDEEFLICDDLGWTVYEKQTH